MITRKVKLISAAMLIALFVLARPAGAAVIDTYYTDYTVFAEGNVSVGIGNTGGTHIGGSVGAGEDVTFGTNVMVTDLYGYAGSVFADEDVIIGDSAYITGRVMGDDHDKSSGGVLLGGNVWITGRVDAGGGTGKGGVVQAGVNLTSGGIYSAKAVTIGDDAVTGDIHAGDVLSIGDYSETGAIWGNRKNINIGATDVAGPANAIVHGDIYTQGTVTFMAYSVGDGDLYYKRNTPVYHTGAYITGSEIKETHAPTAPDSFTYTTRTAPSFNPSGSDVVADGYLAPGTYMNVTVAAGKTMEVSAGTYDFLSISLADGASITIRSGTNPGDVIIQALQDLFTTGSNVLGRVGQSQLVFNVGNNLTIGAGSSVYASLLAYSPTSLVEIYDNSTVLGKVYSAGDIIIYDNVLVPEPGTLVLLGLGAACLLAKRRRGKRA